MILVNLSNEELSSYQRELSFMTYDFNMDHDTDIAPVQKSAAFFYEWAGAYPFYYNIKEEGITLYAA